MAFHCSLSLLDHEDQTDEEVPPGVTLIHSVSGQRKLRFQQNLLIHYSNNSLQVRDCSNSRNECIVIDKWKVFDLTKLISSLLRVDRSSPCTFGSCYTTSVY